MTVPATGWYVEVDNGSSGHTWTPAVVGDPQWTPDLNGLPRIEVPVPKDSKWTEPWADEATMRAWFDGKRLPIEELEKAREEPGQTVLVGIGGTELREPVRKEFDRGTPIHTAAENLITNNTSYSADVDTPTTTNFDNQIIQTADSTQEFKREIAAELPKDRPVRIDSGGVELLQSGWFGEGENNTDLGADTTSDSAASQGSAALCEFDDEGVRVSFTLNYRIPGDEQFTVQSRHKGNGNGDRPSLEYEIDGTSVGTLSATDGQTSFNWAGRVADSVLPLEPGSHEMRVFLPDASDNTDDAVIDCLYCWHDSLFTPNFDNSVDADDDLDGPELYISSRTVRFREAQTVHAVNNIDQVDTTWNDTTNNQSIGVSTDGGSTYTTENNTSTHSGVSISGTEISARFRVTLSRFDDGSAGTPNNGNSGQRMTFAEMQADQEDLPYVNDESFDRRLQELLAELAGRGDFVWEVTWNNGIEVDWTRTGQRTSDNTPNLSDFEFERSTETLVQKATVLGQSFPRFDERFDSNHGTFVDLSRTDLVPNSEDVSDPSFGGQEYERGVDYEMNYLDGQIKVLSGGGMANNTEFSIDFDWRIKNSFDDGTNNPRELTRTIPELTTERACGQAAYRLVDELNEPARPTRVVLTSVEPGWSLIEEIDLAALPANVPLQIKAVQPTPEQTVVRLDARESVGEVVSEIRNRVEGVSRAV